MAKPVFDALGADVRVINAAPDGFNINVDCGSTHMERLQRHVVEQGLDVGFAYDGDADRCLAVDERGRVVDGDQILYVCGVYLNKHGRLSGGTVVPTIASNFGLIKSLELAGLSAVTSGVKDVRDVIERAKSNRFFSQSSPILFIDEIHRFSKSQQDSLLGAVENGTVTLIGATTEIRRSRLSVRFCHAASSMYSNRWRRKICWNSCNVPSLRILY